MVGEFVIPDLSGGSENVMIGQMLWTEFFGDRDCGRIRDCGVLLCLLVVPMMIYPAHAVARARARTS